MKDSNEKDVPSCDSNRSGNGPRMAGRQDPGFATDQSGIVTGASFDVVHPRTVSEVESIVRQASASGRPVVPRGGGTGLEGGAVPSVDCTVVDTSFLDRIIEISPENRTATVGAGMTASRLNALIGQYGLFFPTSPAGSAESATIGGLISTDAKGMYAMRYGSAGSSVLALDVVMPDGSSATFGHRVHHSSSGYQMAKVFAGAEGTLGIITAATIRLHPLPECRASFFAVFDDDRNAAAFCADVASFVTTAAAVELVSKATASFMSGHLPDSDIPGEPFVMAEFHGSGASVASDVILISEILGDRNGRRYLPENESDPWKTRHRFTGSITEASLNRRPGRLDAAVPVDRLAGFVSEIESAAPRAACVFGHAGAGIVHVLMPRGPGMWSDAEIAIFRDSAIRKALELGGTVSGEHGIGMTSISEAAVENRLSLPWMIALKKALDPRGIMNPGKVLPET